MLRVSGFRFPVLLPDEGTGTQRWEHLVQGQTQAQHPGLPAFNPGLADRSTVSAYKPYGAILSARL